MRRYFIFFIFLFLVFTASAQIGHGGQPMMHSGNNARNAVSKKDKITFPAPPAFSIAANFQEAEKGRPLRFAHPNFVELTPENSGRTAVLEDGRLLWQLSLSSPGAFSLNIIFDQFRLVPGDSVFIYNPSGSYVLGAFTYLNNKSWGGLATAPVPGDEVVVEWRGNNSGRDGTRLLIGAVNHDFLDILGLRAGVGEFGRSDTCHTDISCFENDVYLQNGKAAGQVIVNGTDYCSGTLMNNSNNDGTPYILTAAHCLGTNIEAGKVVYIFNYEVPACQPHIQGSMAQSLSGAFLRAFADDLDFALLEMSEVPPLYYRPYYSGWDISTSHSSIVHSIHHPNGDVKKLAVSDGSPIPASFSSTSLFGKRFESDSHWRVARWMEGSTQGGSSGAGLFLEEGAYIGLLSGGSATCSSPVNDYYIRLNKIWNSRNEDTARVDLWLNPLGDGRISHGGFDPAGGSVLRMSHFPDKETPYLSDFNLSDGYWTSQNNFAISGVAERYDELYSGKIYGIYVMPGKHIVSGDGKINFKIWSGIDVPQVLLAQKNTLVLNDSTNKEVLIMFDEPVYFSGPFFVGYEFNYATPVDTFAVYQAALKQGTNSFFVNSPVSGWQPYHSISGDVPSTLWIDVLVDEVVYTDSSNVSRPFSELVLAPNPADKFLDIFYSEDGNGKVTIFNLAGKPVYSGYTVIYNYKSRLICISGLSAGTYLLQLEINGKTEVQKFMVR